jgi:hypothetical protein
MFDEFGFNPGARAHFPGNQPGCMQAHTAILAVPRITGMNSGRAASMKLPVLVGFGAPGK